MTPAILPRAELDKFLSIYALHQRPANETSFKELLTWMEKKQNGQTLLERSCQPGEIIVHEGEPGDFFYVIRSGQAVILKGEIESPTVIGFRTSGDAIGEMALLENRPRSATVIALTQVLLWSLERETFHQFLAENPALSLSLMGILSGRVRESDEERRRGTVRERQKEEVLEDLSKLATFDSLTGLLNRRSMEEILRDEIVRAIQQGGSVGVIMADIDFFKNINDTYGHRAGDLMLQTVASSLKKCVRAADSVCRFGGEEFVIIMPGASFEILIRCAEKIRAGFESLQIKQHGISFGTTISLGVASFPQHGKNGEEILEHADQALYRAKRSGKNRVVLYADQP
ncbi:MAG: GGDEF domain-containing protein [Anaerolineales bacterium]|jgi:diguanylate cyclase (GGDEF)-like protein|nr:GGDEF domain-containing protein [Anaerolineales bacterium]